MKKSVHLTSTHPPFDTRVFWKECRTLVRHGYDVRLVVPAANSEVREGVTIDAVPLPRSGKDRLVRTTWHVFRRALTYDKETIFHVHDYEMLPYALVLRVLGWNVIYDAHEDTPSQFQSAHYLSRPMRRVAGRVAAMVEWISGRILSGIIAAWSDIYDRYPKSRRKLVRNMPLVTPLPDRKKPEASGIRIVYAGGLTRTRGVVEMIEAVNLLPESLDARLVLAGRFFPAGLEEEMKNHPGWDRVDYLGLVPYNQVREILQDSDLGLAILHPVGQYRRAEPVKLFEYFERGLPVVTSDFEAYIPFVKETGAGVMVDPLDTRAVADAIEEIVSDPQRRDRMGKAGREAVTTTYNWENEARELLDLYESLE